MSGADLVRAPPGTPHLVYISVVGADRIPIASRVDRAMLGYFGSKLAAEWMVADSGVRSRRCATWAPGRAL
jgi:uncharacterized protein YbjT (DUF2867 family)